ncbi:MAG: CPBP family intramembrane metalloprotease [Prolixibacteraceae bacterium]|jgi:membrane protease YdiL (CAAX protease family)|nr:CPBP family intramembrane metalloprotease [Prolixibacteraceae bacterium]
MKRALKYNSSPSKLVAVALIALASLFLSIIIAAISAIPLFGMDAFSGMMGGGMTYDESNVAVLKYFQLWQSVGLFVVPAFVLAYLFGGSVIKYLKLNKQTSVASAILATFIVMAFSPFISYVGIMNAEMELPRWLEGIEGWMRQSEDQAGMLTELFVKADSIGILFYNIFLIALIPAIGEEFLFRGVVQRTFHEWTKNKHVAIWVSAILFSALHLQFYGFIPRALLGALFGYMFVWSGNLWLPVIAHFINNAVAVVAYYFYGTGALKADPETLGANMEYAWVAAAFSLVAVVALMAYFKIREEKKRSEIELRL